MSLRLAALRIGLLTATAMFFNVGLILWNTESVSVSLGLSVIAWLLGIFSAALALLPSVPRRASWLILMSLLALAFQTVYIQRQYYSPLTAIHSDNEMIGKYALEALKRGQN